MDEKRGSFGSVVARAKASRGVALMGVCNVTPDSFSDGGAFLSPAQARARVDALIADGADIVDVGGESTRPGAKPVPPEEQLARVLEVVRYAAERCAVSIDTTQPSVADACLRAGACAVNDVSFLSDFGLADVVARHGAALVLMHCRGPQEDMKGFSEYPEGAYADVVAEVLAEWRARATEAHARGVRFLVMDPGLGFSKSAKQSAKLLERTADLVRGAGAPVLVGASRKSFLRVVDPDATVTQREGASTAAALWAARGGASIVRVHDVRAARQAIDLFRRFEGGGSGDA